MVPSVCIVNHNTRNLLRACLVSVQAQAAPEVVVVDSASCDASAAMVQREFPAVTLVASATNIGFGAAANRAFGACNSPYVLLLNGDTLLRPGALEALGAYLDRHPRAAIVGPRLVNSNGELQSSCFPFPTPLDILLDTSHTYDVLARVPVLREVVTRTWAHDYARRVPWVLGAALAIRREAFQAVGGFDDSFFMYYEEVDLCYRLARRGWETHFAPVAEVVHVGGASTRGQRADMTVRFFASLGHFYRRHYTRWQQAALKTLVAGIAFGRLVRDSLAVRTARDRDRRTQAAIDMETWRRLLVGEWQSLGN